VNGTKVFSCPLYTYVLYSTPGDPSRQTCHPIQLTIDPSVRFDLFTLKPQRSPFGFVHPINIYLENFNVLYHTFETYFFPKQSPFGWYLQKRYFGKIAATKKYEVIRPETAPQIMKKNNVDKPTTVKLNVGGKHYEVSRSLIERYPDTMLARLVSDTWQSDPSSTIFIERDGDRFRYILDYMRDDKVFLPSTISKSSILLDLDFFGFEVEPDHINDGCGVAAIARQVFQVKNKHQADMEAMKKERIYLITPHQCWLAYSENGRLEIRIDAVKDLGISNEDFREAFSYSFEQELFDKCLATRGFKYKRHKRQKCSTGGTELYLSLLDEP
jgi:hypothetical protein